MISKSEFKDNLLNAIEILKNKKAVHEFKGDSIIAGDLHGDIDSCKKAFNVHTEYKTRNLVYLGDYVDRGSNQIQTVNELCLQLISEPNNIILLRGNHECQSTCSRYGFKDELKKAGLETLWDIIGNWFSELPIYGFYPEFALFCHGGIPEINKNHISFLDKIKKRNANIENNIETHPLEAGALWNDPIEAYSDYASFEQHSHRWFTENPRGPSVKCYNEDVVKEVLKVYNLKYLIRAHIVIKEGYKWFNPYVLSLFSANSGRYFGVNRAYAYVNNKKEIKFIQPFK